MIKDLFLPFDERFEEYKSDESKMSGYAETIAFPKSTGEVAQILRQCYEAKTPVTVQGGKTGICGGAVPFGGHVLNLSRMNGIVALEETDGGFVLTVQAGLCIGDINFGVMGAGFDEASLKALDNLRKSGHFMWPVEPTERSATVGGVIATDAKGIAHGIYGSVAAHVQEMEVVRPDGTITTVKSPTEMAEFVGTEGIFGVITQAKLTLMPRPADEWGICFLFENEDDALAFADGLDKNLPTLAAAEFLDKTTLGYIAKLKQTATKLNQLPDIPSNTAAMVYMELHGETEAIEQTAMVLMECGVAEENTWALSGFEDVEKLRVLRHAAPEAVNIEIASRYTTKLGTDLKVEGETFSETYRRYKQDAGHLEMAVFGHILGNRLHANLLPKDPAEFAFGQKLIAQWTAFAAQSGGTLFFEHGTGKLKAPLLAKYGDQNILANLKAQKLAVDGAGILNKGTLLGSV